MGCRRIMARRWRRVSLLRGAMNTDLEPILDADEEGRARAEAFERQATARLKEAKDEAERQRRQARETARRSLDEEVQRIASEAEHEAAQRRAQRTSYLAKKEARAETLLPRAAELYAGIVAEGLPVGSPR